MDNEFFKRLLSSIVLIPVVFFFTVKGSFIFNFFLLVCFFITSYEWFRMIKKSLLKINTYQLEVLSKIYKKKEIMTTELLKSQTSYSKAQKYRYLKQLISLGLCKKKHNLYFS